MTSKIINLWTHPRSLSTAFYRVIYERGDFDTVFEPFVHVYYKKVFNKRKMCRLDYAKSNYLTSYNKIINFIAEKSQKNNVFVKDMAFCAYDYLKDDYLKSSINVFLVRDPSKSIPSFYHVLKSNKYFSDKFIKYIPFDFIKIPLLRQIGYSRLWNLFKKCRSFSAPLIINSELFAMKPDEAMKMFCKYCDIDYVDSLKWDIKRLDEFNFSGTRMFHENISKSSGIRFAESYYEENVENNTLLKKIYNDSIIYYNNFCDLSIG